jgi:hypothetical protein
MLRRALLPLIVLAATLVSACESSLYRGEDSTPVWVEYEVEKGPPRRDLFQICHLALVRAGFPPGDNDEAGGKITSGWDVNLAPYSFKGYREQGIIEITPLEGIYHYKVEARVRKDINIEHATTLEISRAEWDPGADNAQRARVVMQHLRSQLYPTGPRR